VAEVVVYRKGEVLISSARVSIGHATYPLANVNAVNVRYTLPWKKIGIAFILVSGYFVWQAIDHHQRSPVYVQRSYLELTAGIASLVVGVWLCFLLRHFHLMFNTGTRQVKVISTFSRTYIDELAFAVKQAIVARG
jgi:hypothetical protein